MSYESLEQAVSALRKWEQARHSHDHAMGVPSLDATTAAPSDIWEGRGGTMEVLSRAVYDLII